MKKKLIFLLFAASFWSQAVLSQRTDAKAYYIDEHGVEQETTSISDGQAPLEVTFRANPSGMEDYSPSYEWHFRKSVPNEGMRELFVRYEENTQYTFTESGDYTIVLKTFLAPTLDPDSTAITISISQSELEFPNAFSPNHDGHNEEFKPKKIKNIVKFHAIIINRYGQKIYEWYDPNGKWDGTHNGHDVREGVYFVLVSAKGSDGKEYNIRQDVNLLRGFREGGRTGGSN